jgi:hypothetical protein
VAVRFQEEQVLPTAGGLQGRVTGLFRSPKTILGFFAVLIGILGVSIFALARVFADVAELRTYIPALLLFGGGAFVFIALAILITAWINPEKLMLGEVRGDVYLQMLKLRQGDSELGEIIEQVPLVSSGSESRIALPSNGSSKQEDGND